MLSSKPLILGLVIAAALAGCEETTSSANKPTVAAGQNLKIDGISFGDDSSRWAKDDECDDPRFEGPGMTETTLLASDILHDATDCAVAYRAGKLRLRSRS